MGNEYKLSFSAKEIDEKLNQISIPNYEQNNAQGKGYIKNRPFYVDDNGGVHKLDTKFLKTAQDLADAAEDEIALAKDVYDFMKNSIPEASIPDWEQNDPQGEGYIKNRPFYTVSTHSKETIYNASTATYEYNYRRVILKTEDPILVPNLSEYFTVGNSMDVILEVRNSIGGTGTLSYFDKKVKQRSSIYVPYVGGWNVLSPGEVGVPYEDEFAVSYNSSGELRIYLDVNIKINGYPIAECSNMNVTLIFNRHTVTDYQLDPRYIPDYISKTGVKEMIDNIPQSDYDEYIPSSSSYIKNRPFYVVDSLFLDESTVIDRDIMIGDDGYTEIPTVYGTANTDIVFNIGTEYTVIFKKLDGTTFSKTYRCTTLAEIKPNTESGLKNQPLIYDEEISFLVYYGIPNPNSVYYYYPDNTYSLVTIKAPEIIIKKLDTKFLNTTSEITENSTSEEIPTAKSVYDIVKTGSSSTTLKNIVIGNTSFDIKNNEIVIPIATKENFGVVKSSSATNDIAVREDGTMEINEINVNKIVQDSGDTLLLASGTSKL
jgi:hypothetical protein